MPLPDYVVKSLAMVGSVRGSSNSQHLPFDKWVKDYYTIDATGPERDSGRKPESG